MSVNLFILDVNACDSLYSPCLYGATCHNVYGGYESGLE